MTENEDSLGKICFICFIFVLIGLFLFFIGSSSEPTDSYSVSFIESSVKDFEHLQDNIIQYANSPAIEIPRCKENATITQAGVTECTEHEAIPGIAVLGVVGVVVVYVFYRLFAGAFLDYDTKVKAVR